MGRPWESYTKSVSDAMILWIWFWFPFIEIIGIMAPNDVKGLAIYVITITIKLGFSIFYSLNFVFFLLGRN